MKEQKNLHNTSHLASSSLQTSISLRPVQPVIQIRPTSPPLQFSSSPMPSTQS
ncbi:unnamed protein product, partial [Rotaria sp. Silwood1]